MKKKETYVRPPLPLFFYPFFIIVIIQKTVQRDLTQNIFCPIKNETNSLVKKIKKKKFLK